MVGISEGLSNQEIADALFLSMNTVKSYIRNAYRKMGVCSRSQAILWAVSYDDARPLAPSLGHADDLEAQWRASEVRGVSLNGHESARVV